MQGLWPFIQQGARVAQWVRSLDLTTHTSLSPIRRGFAPSFVNYKKGCTRLASDKVCQLLVHGRWFSPGTSTTKNWLPWYSWNIVESGIKTPKINQSLFNNIYIFPIYITYQVATVWNSSTTMTFTSKFCISSRQVLLPNIISGEAKIISTPPSLITSSDSPPKNIACTVNVCAWHFEFKIYVYHGISLTTVILLLIFNLNFLIRTRLRKLPKRVHSTRIRKW